MEVRWGGIYMFRIDMNQICKNDGIHLNPDRVKDIQLIEKYIQTNFVDEGWTPVQHGRVIVLRATDRGRKSSAFSASLYLGKYTEMDDINRFQRMVKMGHSYEPIRGESISFLYIGVSKPAYDHLITYTVRNRRIAGGLRANEPWGFVVPYEAKDKQTYIQIAMEQLERCQSLIRRAQTETSEEVRNEQLQAVRSLYPTGVILPPFQFDFSEEALVKNIFRQRIWEKGAQGETADVVNDMWKAVRSLDPEKWDLLYDYHGPHIVSHLKAMRTLRDKKMTLGQLLEEAKAKGLLQEPIESLEQLSSVPLYEWLMGTVGKLPKSMWDK
jgi:hypothetical protein